MDNGLILQQTKVESEAMQHATRSLERAIVWPLTGDEVSRKLVSVLAITKSFQRHMERQFVFEELDGYMAGVCQLHPEFKDKVGDLKKTHGQLRQTIRHLILRLEDASPTKGAIFDAICEKLQNLVSWFREHNLQENELLVEALFRDTGGEA